MPCRLPEHDWSVNPIFIGYDARGPFYGENSAFDGTMDEVAIFNTALTTNEMMQLYAGAQVPPIILVQPRGADAADLRGRFAVALRDGRRLCVIDAAGLPMDQERHPDCGTDGDELMISPLATNDTGNYAVVITNSAGAVTSSVVALTVLSGPPIFVQKPVVDPAVRRGQRDLHQRGRWQSAAVLSMELQQHSDSGCDRRQLTPSPRLGRGMRAPTACWSPTVSAAPTAAM